MLYWGHRTWRKFMGLFRTPESNCLSACQILNEMNHIEESLFTLHTAFPSTVLLLNIFRIGIGFLEFLGVVVLR